MGTTGADLSDLCGIGLQFLRRYSLSSWHHLQPKPCYNRLRQVSPCDELGLTTLKIKEET